VQKNTEELKRIKREKLQAAADRLVKREAEERARI
jgi:hypothetical protein